MEEVAIQRIQWSGRSLCGLEGDGSRRTEPWLVGGSWLAAPGTIGVTFPGGAPTLFNLKVAEWVAGGRSREQFGCQETCKYCLEQELQTVMQKAGWRQARAARNADNAFQSLKLLFQVQKESIKNYYIRCFCSLFFLLWCHNQGLK